NSLKSIGSESFQYCTNLKNVILPESIDLIEEKTFYNCSNLTKIDIPKSVICIKKEAFKKCFNLETINFLGFLETIKKGAFSRCESLKEVVLSGFVKTIGSEAFKCCKNLTKVILPDSVETIGSGIFECCTNLTDVILPKNADFVSITERAFCECIKLERISLPEQINTIKSFAFCQCDNLKTVDFSKIPVGIFNRVYLGDRSFYECKNLKIDEKDFCKFCQHESTFFGCNLECSSLRLPEMDFIIDREKQIVYIKKYKDTSLRYSMDGIFCIPENLRIDGRCFKVCGIKSGAFTLDLNFKTVFIPKTIESIEEEAFCNCSLVNVHCDNCDTLSIAKDAFKSCESLESVVFFNKGFCFNNETKEVFKFSELLEKKKSKYEKQHDENYGNSFQYPHGKLKLSLADKVETLDELKNIYIERYDFDFRVKDRPKHSHLFKHSPSALDVHQSCFGNCYFLASFASFLSIPGNAEKILKNIEDNNDGTVTIALFNKCGNKVFVKVSGEIPEAITEDGNLAVFNKREFTDWISLWFKAYVAASNCKAFEEFKKDICEKERINTKNMTYAHFNGGVPFFVFKYVFGFFNPTIIMTKDIISSPEEKIKVIKKIIESIQKKLPIVCGTNLEVKKEVLDGSHGYALINIKRGTKDRKFYLFLIDPRGRCLFERFPFEESLLNTSGLFYIEFEEFLKNFKILTFAEA
ncbi:MAG: leucine-rich repeat protein, partial [Oscillospiraceae bacterium]|nr:leucine-rich repeat protein [Oscillospiraceae bacterium]